MPSKSILNKIGILKRVSQQTLNGGHYGLCPASSRDRCCAWVFISPGAWWPECIWASGEWQILNIGNVLGTTMSAAGICPIVVTLQLEILTDLWLFLQLEFKGRHISHSAVWHVLVVIDPTRLDDLSDPFEAHDLFLVQAFIPELAIVIHSKLQRKLHQLVGARPNSILSHYYDSRAERQ